MAQGTETRHHDTLEELNSLADRLRDWISANPIPLLLAAGALLLAAGAYGGWTAWTARVEDQASEAFAAVEREYLTAMGASPGSTEIVEPANPETGRNVRRDFSTRFLEVAREHSRARGAWVARAQAGDLLLAAGDTERAVEIWTEAAAGLSPGDEARGLLLPRIAEGQEAAGRWKEAAEAWRTAADLPSFPLRPLALAQAARCFEEAGDTPRAVEAATAVQVTPGPTSPLPAHLEALVNELKARGSSAAEAPGAPATDAKP